MFPSNLCCQSRSLRPGLVGGWCYLNRKVRSSTEEIFFNPSLRLHQWTGTISALEQFDCYCCSVWRECLPGCRSPSPSPSFDWSRHRLPVSRKIWVASPGDWHSSQKSWTFMQLPKNISSRTEGQTYHRYFSFWASSTGPLLPSSEPWYSEVSWELPGLSLGFVKRESSPP